MECEGREPAHLSLSLSCRLFSPLFDPVSPPAGSVFSFSSTVAPHQLPASPGYQRTTPPCPSQPGSVLGLDKRGFFPPESSSSLRKSQNFISSETMNKRGTL